MYKGVRKWKYALVSADYRLAPQVGIQDIFKDVEDCIKFIRDPLGLAASLDPGTIEPARLAVSGSGGGGYLALLAGLHVSSKPQAVLALHPITDPLGSFFTTSHPWDESNRDGLDEKAAKDMLKPCLDHQGKVVALHADDGWDPEEYAYRHLMYKYVLHCGSLAELLHFDFTTNAQLDPENDKWRVARQIAACGMPPTFIMHGEADDLVDVGQSDKVMGALRGVLGHEEFTCSTQYVRPFGYGHAFDEHEGDDEDDSDEDSGDDGQIDDDSDLDWDEDLWADQEGSEEDSKGDSEQESNGDQQEVASPIEPTTNVMYNFMHCFV
jgi:acetyl esterase/lipase